MSDYINLIGAEEVSRAAGRMQESAESMNRAAQAIDYAVDRLVRALDEHANRIEASKQEPSA